jgi:hypothetical protein
MDLAEIRFTSCESPLKLQRHIIQLLAIMIIIANGAHSSICGLLSTTYSCCQWRHEQVWKLFPMEQRTFYNQNCHYM